MQPLQNASDSLTCAAAVIEGMLDVLLLMRETTARGQGRKGGATLIQVRAMGVLRKRPGTTLSFLAGQLALTLSATSRLIEGLVAKGYVARDIPAHNRRTVSLHVTPAGMEVHAQAREEARRELARLLESLPPTRRAALTRSMGELRQALEAVAEHFAAYSTQPESEGT
jgi:DNA-binding MarR family transcriptional regulator